MQILEYAQEIIRYLYTLPNVKACRLYGSLAGNTFDAYSDIDIELDVSGADNGQYLLRLPALVGKHFPVVFYDYSPSLAPEKYVVSIATDSQNPFQIIDIACTARPHCKSVSADTLRAQNDPYAHILKLFTANLKHFLRGKNVCADVQRMHQKIFGAPSLTDEKEMLEKTYKWLKTHAQKRQQPYVCALKKYL